MAWYVGVFEKSGDERIVQYIPTLGVDHAFVRRVWCLPDDYEVGGACYDVTAKEAALLREHIAEKIDLDAFNYELCEEAD